MDTLLRINQLSGGYGKETIIKDISFEIRSKDFLGVIGPNVSGKSSDEIRLGFTEEDYIILQEAADFIYDQSLVKTKVNMKDNIDMSYLKAASLQ